MKAFFAILGVMLSTSVLWGSPADPVTALHCDWEAADEAELPLSSNLRSTVPYPIREVEGTIHAHTFNELNNLCHMVKMEINPGMEFLDPANGARALTDWKGDWDRMMKEHADDPVFIAQLDKALLSYLHHPTIREADDDGGSMVTFHLGLSPRDALPKLNSLADYFQNPAYSGGMEGEGSTRFGGGVGATMRNQQFTFDNALVMVPQNKYASPEDRSAAIAAARASYALWSLFNYHQTKEANRRFRLQLEEWKRLNADRDKPKPS